MEVGPGEQAMAQSPPGDLPVLSLLIGKWAEGRAPWAVGGGPAGRQTWSPHPPHVGVPAAGGPELC